MKGFSSESGQLEDRGEVVVTMKQNAVGCGRRSSRAQVEQIST